MNILASHLSLSWLGDSQSKGDSLLPNTEPRINPSRDHLRSVPSLSALNLCKHSTWWFPSSELVDSPPQPCQFWVPLFLSLPLSICLGIDGGGRVCSLPPVSPCSITCSESAGHLKLWIACRCSAKRWCTGLICWNEVGFLRKLHIWELPHSYHFPIHAWWMVLGIQASFFFKKFFKKFG